MQPADASQLGSLAGAAHIRHYRAGLRQEDPVYRANMMAYNSASGARPLVLTDCKPTVGLYQLTTPQALVAFNNNIGNSADAVEAVNEPDTRMSKDPNWLTDLNACIQPITRVLPLPFLAPALAQSSSYPHAGLLQNMGAANIHIYFSGHNPENSGYGPKHACGNYGSLSYMKCLAAGEAGSGKPYYITETGWNSASGEVDLATQAKYSVRAILFNYANGISRTYFYTLVSYTGADGFGGDGLLNVDRSPKPAFTAIGTLLNAIADDGGTYTPSPVRYGISGVSSSVTSVPIQKRDGTNILAIWNATLSYNSTTATPISVLPQQATITIPTGQSVRSVATISDKGTATSVPYKVVGSNVVLSVDDHVTLITFH